MLTALLVMACPGVWAQNQQVKPAAQRPLPNGGQRWSSTPDEFVNQITNMMRLTKIPSCIEVADQFGATWTNLSTGQQRSLIEAMQHFGLARYRAKPYYESLLLLAIQGQQSLSGDQANLTALLSSASKVARLEPQARIVSFADQARFFLVNQVLYFSKFYNLRIQAPAFSFGYTGTDDATPLDTIPSTPAAKEEPLPSAQQKFDEWGSDATPIAENASPPAPTLLGGPQPDLPPITGAYLKFDKADLTFGTGYDSTTLANTKGTYLFGSGQWVGEGGRFDWTVAGLEASTVYAELSTYSFAVKTAALLAENATLTYPAKLKEPIKGAFEFRSVKHTSPEASRYPRFISYNNNADYKDLGEDVVLVGGFALEGRKITTASVYQGVSTIAIKHKGQEVFRGAARRFQLGDTTIGGSAVRSVIYHNSDSLTQGNARLVYERQPEKLIKLYKNKGGAREAPFFDSYHRVELTCEAAFYKPDSNLIDFYNQTNRLRNPLVIESQDYFTTDRYADVQGLFTFSPIGVLVYYYNKMGRATHFFAEDVATTAKLPVGQIRAALNELADQGFIQYDPAKGEGEMLPKLKHYFSSMKKGKDYDFINILSLAPERQNARMLIDSSLLVIYGVDRFTVNDSLGVYIKPADRILKMRNNRDFVFNGEVSAGIFVVKGEKFTFSYDQYLINLTKIDSIDVLPAAKITGDRARAKNSTRLTGQDRNAAEDKPNFTSGVLYINKPDNKSNLIRLPQFPIFDVQAPAYVYFDKPNILGGAYDKKVYFYVPPFKIDSISGSNLAAVSFDGTFHSDNIFPEFKEKLVPRKDKTLGFEHKVPKEGYKLYKGPGKFYGTVAMDGKGLRGKGYIKYLTTTVKSDDFIFYQDSVVAKGMSVKMEKGTRDTVGYPDAVASAYEMKWLTKADTMYLTNTGKTPWYFYGKRVKMNGTLALNEKGAFGKGLIKASGSRAESPAFTFRQDRIIGREAFFEVQSDNPVKPAFACKNVKFNFFVDKKYAEFSPEEEGYPSNEFPYARYKTSIPHAVWDIEKKIVTMSKPEGADINTSYFYSTLPEQDSLNFIGTSAVYDIAKYALRISGVPYINVADGIVYPDSGNVTVLENADMQPLKNAHMVLDSVNKYHRLTQGFLTIKSRHEFEGEAIYQYVNAVNDTLPIRFDKFEFVKEEAKRKEDEQVHTKSGGEIEEDKPLKIANGVVFKGGVTMWAHKPGLEFDGFVKLDLRKTDTEWLRYATNGESKEFALDLKGATDAEGNPVANGLYIEDGSGELYGVFVNSKRTSQDREVFGATGMMNFNSETQEFKIGPADKLAGKTAEGNLFTYNDSTGQVTFEGKLNLLGKNEKDFSILSSGAGSGKMDSVNYELATLTELELTIPPKAWAVMARIVNERAKELGLGEAMGDRDIFVTRLAEMLGQKTVDEYKRNTGTKTVPIHQAVPRLAKGLTFTDLGFKWHKKQSAFYSTTKLNLLNIQANNVNAQLDGYMEVKRADGLDVVNLYIEASPDAWFFFSLDDQRRMAAVSSISEFTDAVAEKARPDKAKPGSYYIDVAEETERITFIKHFKTDYLGQEVKDSDFPQPAAKTEEAVEPTAEDGDAKPEGGETAKPAQEKTEEEIAAEEQAAKDKKRKKKKGTEAKPEGDTPTEAAPEEGFGDTAPAAKKEEPAKDEPKADEPAKTEAPKEEPAKEEDKPKEETKPVDPDAKPDPEVAKDKEPKPEAEIVDKDLKKPKKKKDKDKAQDGENKPAGVGEEKKTEEEGDGF